MAKGWFGQLKEHADAQLKDKKEMYRRKEEPMVSGEFAALLNKKIRADSEAFNKALYRDLESGKMKFNKEGKIVAGDN